jgi:Domain of unknown function (DUF4259)
MGTWGPGVFENDAASDFASDVINGGGVPALARAIDRVLALKSNYLEAPDSQEGLAAAEVIARLSGNPGQQAGDTASIDAWVRGQAKVPDELIKKAKRSVTRILTEPSELLELWMDSDEFDDWKRSMEELAQRL